MYTRVHTPPDLTLRQYSYRSAAVPTLHIHIYPLDMSCCVYPRISMLPIVHIYVPIWCVCLHCAKIKSMQIWVCNVCACLYLHVCIYKVSRRNKKPAAFSSLLLFMSCFHLCYCLFSNILSLFYLLQLQTGGQNECLQTCRQEEMQMCFYSALFYATAT